MRGASAAGEAPQPQDKPPDKDENDYTASIRQVSFESHDLEYALGGERSEMSEILSKKQWEAWVTTMYK